MPIQTFACPNYYAIVVAVGKDQVFLVVIEMKNGFSTINCGKSCQRPTEIFLFSKYHCTTQQLS